MSYIVVDVEADGPIPGDYSMIEIGAIVVDEALDKTFYGCLKPISDLWIPEALDVTKHSREKTLTFDDPKQTMEDFHSWLLKEAHRPFVFVSDNNGFDWQFINWYFIHFFGCNPFGHSSRNLSDIYKRMAKEMRAGFKHLRKTAHTHYPVDDARGNAEALLAMRDKGLKINFA